MERLSLGHETSYSALEGSIHLSRYAMAKSACSGRRVLDIACGEGYGSALLARWGADRVEGVDISAEAVSNAARLFSAPNLRFRSGRAESLDELFPPHSFDLIVSFETFEHVADPGKFLFHLKNLVKPGGNIMISCPNDHWYYPDESRSNPFHQRKYRYDEFRELTEATLGPATWFLGGLAAGYVALEADTTAAGNTSQIAMMQCEALESLVLPSDPGLALESAQSAYFVGVWGPAIVSRGLAVAPMSLKGLKQGVFAGGSAVELNNRANLLQVRLRTSEDHLAKSARMVQVLEKERHSMNAEHQLLNEAVSQRNLAVQSLEKELVSVNAALEKERTEKRGALLRVRVLSAENELLNEAIFRNERQLAYERERLSLIPWRVVRVWLGVRKFIPKFILRMAGRVIRIARRIRKKAHEG